MIYLDNSATTRPFDEVTEYVSHVMKDVFGNPSSMHMAGVDAENEIRKASETIAGILRADPKEIIFTSGGTESDNLALIGSAQAHKRAGMHLVTTKVEHPAVLETMKHLEDMGYSVTYLDVRSDGTVDPSALKDALTDETILVSVMHVNNEIGAVNDIAELSRIVKEHDPKTIFHTDAVQSFGKIRLDPKKAGVDLMSVSAHKIHGPKGVGFLYVNGKARILPTIFGGGQQKGMRSGTQNVPGIAGLGLAAKLVCDDMESTTETLYDLKKYFIEELRKLDGVSVNGIPDEDSQTLDEAVRHSAPHIISASFEGVRAEVLLHALEAKGIYVSSGSACASNKPATSATLLAIGLPKKLLDSTLRFSLSVESSKTDIDETLNVLEEELPKLRRYSRK